MIHRFTLDAPSFEQVLSAVSVVQQLKEQAPQVLVSDPEEGTLSELVEVQRAIETEPMDLEAALARVVRLARHLTPATGVAVWFFTENDFVCRAATDGFAWDEGLRLEVLARLVVSDVVNPERRDSASTQRSLLVAPIHQGRNIVGGLSVYSLVPNAFSDPDGTRARLLAGLLAHALRKNADAELRQVVNLERTAMLEAMDQIMPLLRQLEEGRGGKSRARTVTAVEVELDPVPAFAAQELPDILSGILTEVAMGKQANFARHAQQGTAAEIEATGSAGEQPRAFLQEEETESAAEKPTVAKVYASSEEAACAAAVEPSAQPSPQVGSRECVARTQDAMATKVSSGTTGATAAGATARRAARVKATKWWASQLEDLSSAVMVASRLVARELKAGMARHWRGRGVQLSAVWSARPRELTPKVAAAVKCLFRSSAEVASGKVRTEQRVSWKQLRNAMPKAASPILVLLILAAYLVTMRTVRIPSPEPRRSLRPALLTGDLASTASAVIKRRVPLTFAKPHSANSMSRPLTPEDGTGGGSNSANTLPRWVWVGPNELDYVAQDVKVRYFVPRSPPQRMRLAESHVKHFGDDVTVRYFTPEQKATLPPLQAPSEGRPAKKCTSGGLCTNFK